MAETLEREKPTITKIHFDGAVPIKRARTELAPPQPDAQIRRRREAEKTYGRGRKIPLKNIKDRKLRGNLKALESKYKDATLKAKDAEILLENTGGFLEPENELERTYKVNQRDIKKDVAIQTAQMGFELKLDGGPYVGEYTRNGRELLLAGRKGHVATMDWRNGKLGCELQLGETVRDARWLHNNQMFAVAQKKYVYIYDQAGVELHCLKKHIEVTNMEFLPYHYLLATVVCNIELDYNEQMLTFTGQSRIPEVSRRLHRPNGHRNTYSTWLAYISHSESTQRNSPYGPPERHSHSLVSQFYNSLSQASSTSRSGPVISRGPRRQIHGLHRTRHEDGCLGYPDVQGSEQLLYKTARIISVHFGSGPNSSGMGNASFDMEGTIHKACFGSGEDPKSVYGVGRRWQADRASKMVSI